MRFMILLPVALGIASIANASPPEAAVAQPPAAAPAAEAQPAAAPKAKPAEPKKICRREAIAGSNLKEKICMTAEQWRRQQDN